MIWQSPNASYSFPSSSLPLLQGIGGVFILQKILPSTPHPPRIKIASAENSALICAFMHTIQLTGIPGEKKLSQKRAARTNQSFYRWDIRVVTGVMLWNGWFFRIRILPS